MHGFRDPDLALVVGDGANAIMPAKHHLLDRLEGVLIDPVSVDVEWHRAAEARLTVEHEVPVGAAQIDHGPVAHALREQILQRRAEIGWLDQLDPNNPGLSGTM